jgi:hypothetical protein
MFIVTGCGRSGTGYIYSRLKASGINCGHENVFTSNGFKGWNHYVGDSSWYAAPFISEFESAKVIHVVRDPQKVISSFHRIGVFSTLGWRNFIINPSPVFIIKRYLLNPKRIFHRVIHVKNIRRLLFNHSECLNEFREVRRIEKYWLEWNLLIEEQLKKSKNKYLRIKIEEIDENWDKITNYLGFPINISASEAVNKKTYYSRKPIDKISLSKPVKQLAIKYGYDY